MKANGPVVDSNTISSGYASVDFSPVDEGLILNYFRKVFLMHQKKYLLMFIFFFVLVNEVMPQKGIALYV